MESQFTVSLEMMQPNVWAKIVDVYGEVGWMAQMQAMGLQTGKRIRVVRGGETCVIEIDSTRLCLRTQNSGQILLQPVESGE